MNDLTLNKLFYIQLETQNEDNKAEIDKLESDIIKLKSQIKGLVVSDVLDKDYLKDTIFLLNKDLKIVKQEQIRIDKIIKTRQLKYSRYRILEGDEKINKNIKYYFYSDTFDHFIMKFIKIKASMYKNIKIIEKIINEKYKNLSSKNFNELKKVLSHNK